MLFYVELHISAVVLEKAFLWKSILKNNLGRKLQMDFKASSATKLYYCTGFTSSRELYPQHSTFFFRKICKVFKPL